MSNAFQKLPAHEWVDRLQAADIAAVICADINALRAEYNRLADDTPGIDRGSYSFSTYEDHPSGHKVTQLDPYAIRPTHSKIYALSRPEKFGHSTRQIMKELGYSESQIEESIASGYVSDSWSQEYLPS